MKIGAIFISFAVLNTLNIYSADNQPLGKTILVEQPEMAKLFKNAVAKIDAKIQCLNLQLWDAKYYAVSILASSDEEGEKKDIERIEKALKSASDIRDFFARAARNPQVATGDGMIGISEDLLSLCAQYVGPYEWQFRDAKPYTTICLDTGKTMSINGLLAQALYDHHCHKEAVKKGIL